MSDVQSVKRGRPNTDSVDRLRAKLWYWAVKARGGWSDYRLDIEFVRNDGEERREGSMRRRAFERIRRDGVVPSSGTHRKRNYDLIARVDAHPNFAGTATIFRSTFWDLLKSKPMDLPTTNTFVREGMSKHGIMRPTFKQNIELAAKSPGLYFPIDNQKYKLALTEICREKSMDLDFLALIGGLFWEAYLACELRIALVLHEQLGEMLDKYCDQDWLSAVRNELLELIEQRIMSRGIGQKLMLGGTGYDDSPLFVINRPLMILNS